MHLVEALTFQIHQLNILENFTFLYPIYPSVYYYNIENVELWNTIIESVNYVFAIDSSKTVNEVMWDIAGKINIVFDCSKGLLIPIGKAIYEALPTRIKELLKKRNKNE